MTEKEIRSKVVEIAKGWLGCKESDGSHKKIIDTYNACKPLPRSYAVKYTDAWCATFASAVGIKAGLTDIIPRECSCNQFIQLAKNMGIWVENDAYTPLPQWRVSHHHRRENPSTLHCGGCAGTLRVRNGRSIYEYFQRKEVPDMNEKITAHPQKEEREKVLKEIRQLENRKKILENKQRNEERRVRTRRLIERGAILEGIFPLASSLSGAEVKAFLIALSYLPGAAELTANLPKSGDMP